LRGRERAPAVVKCVGDVFGEEEDENGVCLREMINSAIYIVERGRDERMPASDV
jgi:hypothetical protein